MPQSHLSSLLPQFCQQQQRASRTTRIRNHRNYSKAQHWWWMQVGFIIVSVLLFVGWIQFFYNLYTKTIYSHQLNSVNEKDRQAILPLIQQQSSLLSPKAYPVYGTYIEYDFHRDDGEISKIHAVHTLPSSTSTSKGVVILLHACTHNALKFFSPSTKCPQCIGLSEELQITRLVVERNYIPIAITCHDIKSGCWSDHPDVERIKQVLHEFTSVTHPELFPTQNTNSTTIYAIGASSGGYMAAQLLSKNIVNGAVIMVMGLRTSLLDKLLKKKDTKSQSLFLAPMIKDKATTKRVKENYKYLLEQQQQSQSLLHVRYDEISCQPLPVTVEYLWNRVPGMTKEAASLIIDILTNRAKHINSQTSLLDIDPTKSNWRDYLLAESNNIPQSLIKVQKESPTEKIVLTKGNNSNHPLLLWKTFDLTPGISPLAKALHRAWAYHEYCSEVIIPALDFFEDSSGQTKR